MIVLNFSHPLTDEQVAQLEHLTGQTVDRTIERPAHFDNGEEFGPQVTALADRCELTAEEWQNAPLFVVPPSLSVITALLLAELHGRRGDFLPCVRLRPVEGSLPTRYEVTEILDLQAQRAEARQRRVKAESGQ